MNKIEAIIKVNKTYQINLNSRTCHFANINASKPVWWFDIPVGKLDSLSEINLILADGDSVKLMQIPTNFLKENLHGLKIRKDKDMFSLEIETSSYQNVVGTDKLSFRSFLK